MKVLEKSKRQRTEPGRYLQCTWKKTDIPNMYLTTEVYPRAQKGKYISNIKLRKDGNQKFSKEALTLWHEPWAVISSSQGAPGTCVLQRGPKAVDQKAAGYSTGNRHFLVMSHRNPTL